MIPACLAWPGLPTFIIRKPTDAGRKEKKI
jgi:hypothetical protein